MFKITCPTCGFSTVDSVDGKIAVCSHCKTAYPIPRGYTLLESSFQFAADARQRRDFTAAQSSYSEIIRQHPDSAAAYWFRAISRYQVEYQDIGKGQYRLVCHQALLKNFAGDEDVQKAISLAEGQEKTYYQAQCNQISQLQRAVSSHAALTAPYDVFLAVDAANPQALEKARKIRTGISAAGMRCICPALDLGKLPRQDWEPSLYHGITTASAMVYVAQGADSFTPDALFDAGRYLHLKADNQRTAAGSIQQLILAFADLDEYADIPDMLFDGSDLRISMSTEGFLDQLCQILKGAGPDYDNALHTESGSHENYAYTNLIRQARLSLEQSDFSAATDAFNQILDFNPRESQAYWGLLLAEFGCVDEDALIRKGGQLNQYSNYRSAIAFASEREAQTYQQVADSALQTYQLHAAQAAERKRRLEEQAAARAKQDEELLRDMQAKKSRKARAKILRLLGLVLVVILLIVGVPKIRSFIQARNANSNNYKAAMEAYNSGSYGKAMELFQELGDYKDSAAMYELCVTEERMSNFYNAQFYGDNLANRADAVRTMRNVVEYIPEAQDYLDRWAQECVDYYNAGEYSKAYDAVKGFGSSHPDYYNIWRMLQAQGLVASNDNGAALAIDNGELEQLDCEYLNIPEGKYRSVSLCTNSAALVRDDGTVLLAGKAAKYYDVSNWTDIQSVQVALDIPAALRKDGTLFCGKLGAVADNIQQFDFDGEYIAAVRKDGSIYCNFKQLTEAANNWTDAAFVSIETALGIFPGEGYAILHIVNQDNTLHTLRWDESEKGISVDGSEVEANNVVALVTDTGTRATLYTDGTLKYPPKKFGYSEFDDVFLFSMNDIFDVFVEEDLRGGAHHAPDEATQRVLEFVRKLKNVRMADLLQEE